MLQQPRPRSWRQHGAECPADAPPTSSACAAPSLTRAIYYAPAVGRPWGGGGAAVGRRWGGCRATVKIWFQNRRMKWRNSKERELLATGGSREQTLPNKNNPNPDLSDVSESFVSSDAQRSGEQEDVEDMGDDEDRSTPAGTSEFESDIATYTEESEVECSAPREPIESLITASQLSLSHVVSRSSDSSSGGGRSNAQSSSSSPKLLIKNLSTLGGGEAFVGGSSTAGNGLTAFSSGFRTDHAGHALAEASFSDDEDINVTDDMTASHNEDSEGD
ncbi:hypothetical protein HAZT_HAZT005358 [Hyalella azteca]|uniref:Homeobox domain-containing protein n=1 Tax=Hyalella azteca TaxID=294128 RepID=A0A6A0GQD7_HYAAZ|nr:hypothetical protein HAZT_HAZT005358 [Hyalella azteca]